MRGLPIAALVMLAGCATTMPTTDPSRQSATLPGPVAAALPSNIPDEAVIRDSDGCYAYRDPAALTGFTLVIGIDGRQLCDGRFPDPAAIAALAADMAADIRQGSTPDGMAVPAN